MASNETILAWRAQLEGAENVKDGLRKINEEVKKGHLTQTEANRVIQTATKDTRNFRAEQNLLVRSFQTAHPQLTTLTRAMSTLSGVARAGMNIATTLNTMWIRQSLNMGRISDANYEAEKATRARIAAEATGDPEKIADALEAEAIALEHLGRAQKEVDNGFWAALFDVATVTSSVATAVTLIFTNLMKNPTIAAAIIRAGSFFGGVFSGFFVLAAKAISSIAAVITNTLGITSPVNKAAVTSGTTTGASFGAGFLAGVAGAVTGVALGAILFPTIDKALKDAFPFYKQFAEERDKISNANANAIFGKDSEIKKDLQANLPGFFGPGGDEPVTGKSPEKIEEEVSFFQPLIDLFTVSIPDALKTLTTGFESGWKGITNLTNVFGAGLVNGVNDIFKSLISSMNNAITSYNRAAKKMGKSTVQSLTFSPASFTPIQMPSVKAATGFNGMINRPTMFLAGEAGPENVSITPNGGSSNGGITVVVNVQGSILTERELFRRVDENLKNELKKRNFRILQ